MGIKGEPKELMLFVEINVPNLVGIKGEPKELMLFPSLPVLGVAATPADAKGSGLNDCGLRGAAKGSNTTPLLT